MKLSDLLNHAQRKAVMHGEGPMLVLAGPGSGKTFVITNRIAYLIGHYGVDPTNILVITFTKDAAVNMKNRFLSSHTVSQPVNFGTFHAVFYQILKSSGYRQTDAVLTDSEKKRYIIPILKDYIREQQLYPSYGDNLEEEAVRFLAAISCYKNTGDRERAESLLETTLRMGFEPILVAYEQKRCKCKRLDFDDMLYQCQQLLEEDDCARRFWQGKFHYIMIDEFQDINPRQYEIVKLLAGEKCNIFAVGDDDQSIYGFRGADPGIMHRFLSEYNDSKLVVLNLNYRSTPSIVKGASIVIRDNTERFDKKSEAYSKEEDIGVIIQNFADKQMQYQFLAQKIRSMNREECKSSAVLFRTNAQMQSFSTVLRKEKIPYNMKEKGKCIYDHFVARDIRSYLQFAVGRKTRSLLLKFMNKPYRNLQREALEEDEVSFEKVRQYYLRYAPREEHAKSLFELGELEEGLNKISGMTPFLSVQYIRHKMRYDSYLRKKAGTDYGKLEQWMEVLSFLTDDASRFNDAESWFQHQDAFRQEIQKRDTEKTQEGVNLMTVHASKGLEFDTVWIPDVNEGMYPYGHMLAKEAVEEERRLLYVAMTRAKKSLGITFVTGTKERPRLMSGFLNRLVKTVGSTLDYS